MNTINANLAPPRAGCLTVETANEYCDYAVSAAKDALAALLGDRLDCTGTLLFFGFTAGGSGSPCFASLRFSYTFDISSDRDERGRLYREPSANVSVENFRTRKDYSYTFKPRGGEDAFAFGKRVAAKLAERIVLA